jgi:cbb3-type cytochrome oxidase maturation protein
MTMLYLILPIALVFAAAAVAAFVWTVRSGQLDDVDTPPRRILFDDERARHASDPLACDLAASIQLGDSTKLALVGSPGPVAAVRPLS